MKYTVQPLTKAERPVCPCCGKLLKLRHPEHKRLALDEEASFATNRRVVHRIVEYGWRVDGEKGLYASKPNEEYGFKVIGREPYKVVLTFAPDSPREWGYDGTFCTLRCALSFAHAALRAGYRIVKPRA